MNNETTEKKTTQTSPTPSTTPAQPTNPRDDDMALKFFDKDFIYDCMSVPTDSHNEFRMVTFVMRYCDQHNIKYEFDNYGNIYLTKGTIKEGEYYPCVTAHLDTVQKRQYPYAKAGVRLQLNTTRTANDSHKVSVDGMGIGADDKGGVCIGLAMFNHHEVLKAVFFLEEEVGMLGSKQMDKSWFDNVGYVIGYDSPDLNRAAWKSSGTKLFDGDFYRNHLKEVCDKWGMTDFRSEPFTDVSIIAQETDIICMNFGNGGYNAHSSNEYIIIEDMDHALGMGADIITHLGKKRFSLQHKYEDRTDNEYLETLSSTYRKYTPTTTTTYANSSSQTSSKASENDIKKIKYETLEYVVARYEHFIDKNNQAIIAKIKDTLKDSPEHLKTLLDFMENLSTDEITF